MQTPVERFRSGMSVFTSRAVDAMKDGKAGDAISLARMEEVVGRPCGSQTLGRANVVSAIRHVLRVHRVAWEWDRSAKGWRCLSSIDKLEVMPTKMKRARSQIRRGLAIISTANYEELSAEQQKTLKTHAVHAKTVLLFSTPRSMKKLQDAGFEIRKPNMHKMLELMKRR